MNNLTKDLISTKYNTGPTKKGWHASFYASGQLKDYGFYLQDLDGYYPEDYCDVPRGWSIHLGDNDGTGSVEYHQHYIFPDPERHDERSPGLPQQFERWLQMNIKRIAEEAYVYIRCSFCEKGQEEVRKLIAERDIFICNECVEMCADIAALEEGI